MTPFCDICVYTLHDHIFDTTYEMQKIYLKQIKHYETLQLLLIYGLIVLNL